MTTRAAQPIVLILVMALALRLLAGWVWQWHLQAPFGFGDSLSYWQLAQDLAAGRPYCYGDSQLGWIFRTPGYPLLLAPIFWIAGPEASPLWGRALGALLGTAAVAGVWWLARLLFDPKTGLVAAAVAAVYPGAIATSILVLSEAPFCPIMLLHLGLWTAAWLATTPRRAAGWAFAAGMAGGWATLVRPSWLLFIPFAVAVLLLVSPQRKRNLGLAGIMLLGLAVTMTPWWIRNARLTGHFVPTSLQMGASLYDGWNPRATGGSDMYFVDEFVAAFRRNPPQTPRQYPAALEYHLDRQIRDAAVNWAKEHPGRVFQLALIKFVRLWNVWPNEPSLTRWPIRLGVFLTYVPILILGIIGSVGTIRRGLPYVLCWLPAVYLTCLHMVFVSSIRYREPAMLALIVLAAGIIVYRPGETSRNRKG
jgi:4-amino-4-deoxy-L-arabinose transferase-like glycosyltransferase